MPALNFQKQFAEAVKNGSKTQTIRTPRKSPIKEGDTLYLYTGMRTKQCEKLKEVKCTGVVDFRIIASGAGCIIGQHSLYYLDHLNRVAVADGFKDWFTMVKWFGEMHGLPFEGNLILWK